MAESYSVKATLSATDKGFSSTLKNAIGATESLASKIKGGFAFGVLAGVGQQAFSVLTSGVSGLISEIDSSNAAWKTFSGNMSMLGKGAKEIDGVKKELQDFAQQTVYSASDMATTYSQLAAVGTKNTTQLVKGFGGLAAAAENPQQAMKTLSQQATQMAAKPKVAWEDFKLMLEQSPAGMAAVAKEMGMSTQDMVKAVQDGKIKTEDFFDAISKVGTNESFSKLATEAKTVGQAVDGLKETVGNKLTPAFEVLSQIGIKAVEGISDKLSGIDGNEIANKLTAGIEMAKPYWDAFKEALSSTWEVLKKLGGFLNEHRKTIAKVLPIVLKLAIAYKAFKFVNAIVPGMQLFTRSLATIAGKGMGNIAKRLFSTASGQQAVGKSSASSGKQMLTAAKATLMMGAALLLVSASFALLAYSAIQLANAGGLAIGVMVGMVAAVALLGVGMAALLKSLAPMSAQLMPAATAMLALGAAVVLVAAGFAIMAAASIALANAGGLAIGVMIGMVAAFALLAVGAAALAPALTAGAVGFIAFGAALALVGVGAVLAAAALAIVSAVLPTVCEYGAQGALSIAALGAGMIAFAAGALAAGAACIVLGAGITVVAVGLALVGAAVLLTATGTLVLAAGMAALAAGSVVLAAGLMVTSAALLAITATLPLTAAGALLVVASFTALLAISVALSAMLVVLTATFVAMGVGAAAGGVAIAAFGVAAAAACVGVAALAVALKSTKSSLSSMASSAKSTQSSLKSMVSSVKIVESGLNALGSKAKSAMNSLISAFSNAASKAQSSGKQAGDGFANGMKSGLNKAVSSTRTATNQIGSTLNSAASRAKSAGNNLGNGFTAGVRSGMSKASAAASAGVSAVTSRLRTGYGAAYSAGAYIGMGFAAGMRSQLASIRSAAAQMAAAADAAIRAKAKINSPSKVSTELGEYFGAGFTNGINSMIMDAQRASEKLVSIPNLPKLQRHVFSGQLAEDYEYTRNAKYTIIVPVEMDGREVARVTAPYTEDELNRRKTRNNRKKGCLA